MFLTMQGGFLGPFAWVLGKLLDVIYNFLANDQGLANLGLCIIIFTVIVKLILFPLTFNQQKTSKINMMIQPEIQKIQKKYKGKKDQESMMKQQQEMQELYDKYGTSMTSGCLPMLIQLPIIYALYRVIQKIPAYVGQIKSMYSPIAEALIANKGDNAHQFLIDFVSDNKISGASYSINRLKDVINITSDHVIDVISNFGIGNLNDLIANIGVSKDAAITDSVNKIDEIHHFVMGINIAEAPGYHLTWALLIPLSSSLFNYLSMKLTSGKQNNDDNPANSMMKSMQITMPLMSFFICVSLPAAIGIYWAMSALISLIIQLVVNYYYDHADMDKILAKQVEKAAKKRAKNGGKKSFMQRMMDQSADAQEQYEKQAAMKKNSSISLKNYVPSEEAQQAVMNKQNKQYKSGSIGAKANIMLNYNNTNKGDKE